LDPAAFAGCGRARYDRKKAAVFCQQELIALRLQAI
jgi:hypothetical protein